MTRPAAQTFAFIGLLISIAAADGCTPGIQWRAFSMDYAQSDSQRGEKLQFVYLRHWAVPACTQFEDNVLKDAAVRSATADMYPIVLDFRIDRKIADAWKIAEPPAVAILDPGGRVIERASGPISVESLVNMIQRAKRVDAGVAAPRPAPATRPIGRPIPPRP